jgi:probable DNA repair protein
MNDEVWPSRPSPNPFIPLALQRQYNVPHSSPAREFGFATRVSQRLLHSASEIVVSYAQADTERELSPSPLFASLPPWIPELTASIASPEPPAFETVVDAMGPAVKEGALTAGGTRALELQAKCPFRAFAEIRLGARELETPEPGLDPRERGGFLHTALELFWKRIPSSVALRAASPEALAAALADSVDQALARHRTAGDELTTKLLELERIRLLELITSWIELEKQRAIAFTVEEPEQQRTVQIGGLTVQVRLDRLDKLANGFYALVDYKSRAPKLGDWDGERPESPQVPIYAVTAREPLAALAFGQVRTAENAFKGYSILEGALPGVRPIDAAELDERISEWRRVLETLGNNFRAGRAEVDPKDRFKTCDLCHLPALCRVEEK